MTEPNSTPHTPEPTSEVSPSTRWQPKVIGIPNFKRPRRQNKKNTVRQVTGKSRVGRDFNLKWPTGRWYRIVFTSMSDTSAVDEAEVYVSSLRGLMLNVVEQIGHLNRRHAARHFSVTMIQIQPKGQMQQESVPILQGQARPPSDEPHDTSHDPIDQELHL